jgi:hypothetical protein
VGNRSFPSRQRWTALAGAVVALASLAAAHDATAAATYFYSTSCNNLTTCNVDKGFSTSTVLDLTVFNTAAASGGTQTVNKLVDNLYTFSNSYGAQPTPAFTVGTPPKSYGFYDDYVFTIGANQINSVTSSLSLGTSLGITDLQARLYRLTSEGIAPLTTTPQGPNIQGWSQTTLFSGGALQAIVIGADTPVYLSAGTYVLEIRGTTANGIPGGGGYSGNLNLTAVPLPASLWTLLGGLGVLGVAARRRRL